MHQKRPAYHVLAHSHTCPYRFAIKRKGEGGEARMGGTRTKTREEERCTCIGIDRASGEQQANCRARHCCDSTYKLFGDTIPAEYLKATEILSRFPSVYAHLEEQVLKICVVTRLAYAEAGLP